MLSNKYKKPLSLKLKPSKTLLYFILFIHFLAFSVLTLSLNIPVLFLIILFVFISASLFISLKQIGFVKTKYWVNKIETLKEMEWCLHSTFKQSLSAELQYNWFSLPMMLILYFKIAQGKTRAIIILPDMVNENDFRQLKLHLNKLQS